MTILSNAADCVLKFLVTSTIWGSAAALFLFETYSGSKKELQGPSSNEVKQESSNVERTRRTVLAVGLCGSGQSTFLNLLCDAQVFRGIGGQLKGTRGCHTRQTSDGMVLIDVEGLPKDRVASVPVFINTFRLVSEKLSNDEDATLSAVFICLDLESRADPRGLTNLLSIIQILQPLKQVCYLVMTKWQTNSVMKEWNHELRQYIKRSRETKLGLEINSPPQCCALLRMYKEYLLREKNTETHPDLIRCLLSILQLFDDKIIWPFGLDEIQVEDKRLNCLDEVSLRLYKYYRDEALKFLSKSSGINLRNCRFFSPENLTSFENSVKDAVSRSTSIGKVSPDWNLSM